MNTTFKNIGLICKPDASEISDTVKSLCQLLTDLGLNIIADRETASHVKIEESHIADITTIAKHCDLIMSIGGDGTMLSAARALVDENIPLLGINLGRLGFLVDISPEDMTTKLTAILSGEFHVEDRIMLNAQIISDNKVVHEQTAFNEVAIHRLNSPNLIEIETFINDKFLNSQRSDGLIVATPTGSTAYALSCSGPIMEPSLDALVLVPINPHTLSNRPIVVDGKSIITINFSQRDKHQAQLTCDNVILPLISEGDQIRIQQHPKKIRLLHPIDHDFFDILRIKLDWSRTP
ncbi:MAG: NAD(+) kinase [Piscirickettsiaceae bacterium]|nr:MAG: NAD(+) kinase [Piscirickettsiaceae bacterium]